MIYKPAFVLFILLAWNLSVQGQEYLHGLTNNPSLLQERLKSSQAIDTVLNLPFFDDFSNKDIYPDETRWKNKDAYINNTYGIGPVSYGVATFDALDENGLHYPLAASNPYMADKLTSQAINLAGANIDSLYFSFYFQPQGYGNAPETNDSLLLQFTADGIAWETVWYAKGTDYTTFRNEVLNIPDDRNIDTLEFKLVHLKIDSVKYLTTDFQFRWLNYASLSDDSNPSAAINADHWNIDYVYLNDNRFAGDTIFNDVSMIEAPGVFLRNYTSVPWPHYPEAIKTEISNLRLHLRNNSDLNRNVTQLSVHFEQTDLAWADSFNLGQFDLFPFENTRFPELKFSSSPIQHNANEKANFLIEARIKTDDVDFKGNNVSQNTLEFHNYYAYDDGSAENAYGVDGIEARIAYRYSLFQPDSLQGVNMFFARNNPQYAAGESFSLAVWDDNNGKPGNILAIENGKYPEFENGINGFVPIALDSAIWVEGVIYIGWIKNSTLRLNVGWDNNKFSQSNLFFNINGEWVNTEFFGSLMMRPVFGNQPLSTTIKEEVKPEIRIYPNPAKDVLFIKGLQPVGNTQIQIINMMGSLVLQDIYMNGSINIQNLPKGVYLVRIISDSKPIATQQLMIIE